MRLVKKWILAAGLLGFCAAAHAVPSGPVCIWWITRLVPACLWAFPEVRRFHGYGWDVDGCFDDRHDTSGRVNPVLDLTSARGGGLEVNRLIADYLFGHWFRPTSGTAS